MKLEVGMYVRTELYSISRIIDIEDLEWVEIDKNKGYLIHRDTILKASHNIIDLIEVGDYVNGLRVVEVREHLHNDIEIILSNGEFQWSFSKNESDYDIKSIVTKEQFESAQYKVD